MAEYTCSVCKKKFDDEEKNLTNHEHKCILHCDKEKIFSDINVQKKFEEQLRLKYIGAINKFENIVFPSIINTLFEEFYNVSFKNCTFYGDISITKNYDENSLLFTECEFYKKIYLFELNNKYFIFKDCKFSNNTNLVCDNSSFKKNFLFSEQNIKNKKDRSFPSDFDFVNCIFDVDVIFTNFTKNLNNLSFDSCIMNNLIDIRYIYFGNNLRLKNCTFNGDLYISENWIQDFCLINCNVNKIAVLSDNRMLNRNVLNSTTFKDLVTFQNTNFKAIVNLKNVRFFSTVIFQDVVIQKELNLRDTIFYESSNFLGISAEKRELHKVEKYIELPKAIKVSNRETARKIKDSFERQNNIIEANKYYAIEMIEREKELEITKNKNWFELLVFKIHGISSNHSQDALLALFWILTIGLFASSLNYFTIKDELGEYCNLEFISILGMILLTFGIGVIYWLLEYTLEHKKHLYFLLLGFYIIYICCTSDVLLTVFSNTINPFSIMIKGDSLNFGILVCKIIIAYLIYQFIVSVRQNTRRK